MNKTCFYIGIGLLILVIAGACEQSYESCLQSEGEITTKVEPVDSFLYIEVNDVFTVHLCNDTTNKIAVKGGSNLLPYVHHSVRNDTLYLNNSISCKWARKYRKIEITIHVDTVEKMYLTKPVRLTTKDTFKMEKFVLFAINDFCEIDIKLNCNKFYIRTSYTTSGDFTFSGQTDYGLFAPNYTTKIDARRLKAKAVKVLHHSLGPVHVHASKQLEANIYSKGKVYYSGNPDHIKCNKKSQCIAK